MCLIRKWIVIAFQLNRYWTNLIQRKQAVLHMFGKYQIRCPFNIKFSKLDSQKSSQAIHEPIQSRNPRVQGKPKSCNKLKNNKRGIKKGRFQRPTPLITKKTQTRQNQYQVIVPDIKPTVNINKKSHDKHHDHGHNHGIDHDHDNHHDDHGHGHGHGHGSGKISIKMKIVVIMLIGGILFLIGNALNFKFNIYSKILENITIERPKAKTTVEKPKVKKVSAKQTNESIIVEPLSNSSNTNESKPKKKKKKVKQQL